MSESLGTHPFFPGSPAYNKAHKHYLRTTRHRPSDSSSNRTAFRAAEKKYMAKFPPPDLSEVLDLALLDAERKAEVDMGKWKGRAYAIEIRETALKEPARSGQRAFCVPRIPGLVILPGYLCQETQRELVHWSLADHAREPNKTNLDAHYEIPREGLWNLHVRSDRRAIVSRRCDSAVAVAEPQVSLHASDRELTEFLSQANSPPIPSPSQLSATASELIPKLRWANIGWFYNWGSKQYEFNRGKIEVGDPVRSICKEIVRSVNWKDVFGGELPGGEHPSWSEIGSDWESWNASYEPDAGIVNFYQYKDTLMGHVDRAEVCATSPLVSLSLGNAAVFLIGGLTRDEKPVAILLRSGDAVVMAGPGCRRAFHGVPRILEGTSPAHFDDGADSCPEWTAYSRYIQTTRVNMNVRQVFPKDVDP